MFNDDLYDDNEDFGHPILHAIGFIAVLVLLIFGFKACTNNSNADNINGNQNSNSISQVISNKTNQIKQDYDNKVDEYSNKLMNDTGLNQF